MRYRIVFIVGLAVGYVLGTRAGREKYEQMMTTARKAMDNPTVQETTGQIQAQANKLIGQGKDTLANSKLGERMRGHNGDNTLDDSMAEQKMSANSF